jgi:hypothetical protein
MIDLQNLKNLVTKPQTFRNYGYQPFTVSKKIH